MRLQATVIAGLVVLVTLVAAVPAPAFDLFDLPPLKIIKPPYVLNLPDFKIKDIDVCYDPLSDRLYIDVDIKNRGTRSISGSLRIHVEVKQNGTTRYVSRTVTLSIPAGQTVTDVAVGSVTITSTNDLEVKAEVDKPYTGRSLGDWWESNESNNVRIATFTWGGSFCGFREV